MENEKKFKYVPDEFKDKYELYLKQEEYKESIKGTLEKQRKEFLDSIKPSENIDRQSIKKWKIENEKKMVNKAFDILIKYCIDNNIKKYKTIQKGDTIVLSYLKDDGNIATEIFSIKELLKQQNEEQK